MGIDIYLNGYEAHEERTKQERKAFESACNHRNSLPEHTPAHAQAQREVSAAYGAINSGSKGYIRSSYNSSGLFNVLEEIFGLDIGAYLFPGPWENDVVINGKEFVLKVRNLQITAALALERKRSELPWADIFTEVSGQKAPDPHPDRTSAEEFGKAVMSLLASQAMPFDKIEPSPREAQRHISEDHVWYLTRGLGELLAFGRLAEKLNLTGEQTFATISY